jgi:hypothetical protein
MVVAISRLDSMDISIACRASATAGLKGPHHIRSSRDDEWKPCVGQLQFSGVNRVQFLALDSSACDRRELTRRQPARDALQRMTRGNLRLSARVDVPADSHARLPSNADPFGFQTRETRTVDWLERQAVLEPRLAGRFERPRGLDGFVALSVRPEALETDGASGRSGGFPHPTRATERFWASAFELATWQRNPLVINRFVQSDRHASLPLLPVYGGA